MFFTAIEVARRYLETLHKYDVRTALLVGRSTDTHMVHAGRLAELVAASGQGGFGHTRPGVELLAHACPLPGYASAWPDEWEFGAAPCKTIHEGRDKVGKLCPAWSLCGRARTRDLIVFDEVDEAQKTLDDHGALTLKLTGDDQSVHIDVQRTAGLLAANRAPISDQVLRYILRANEFERHTLRFVAEIRPCRQQPQNGRRPACRGQLARRAAWAWR